MRVFVTGASGWIGSAVVTELLGADYQVLGLARSAESTSLLAAKGAEVVRGDLDDLESLRAGAAGADAVVHLANKHDWGNPAESDRAERAAVQALCDALVDSGKPLMVANGLSGLTSDGRTVYETDASPAVGPDSDRGGSENLVLSYADRGVRSMAIRFAPTVHGFGDWGFITFLVDAARRQGVSGYIGDGSAVWSAVHRDDAARLIRLGLEHAPAGTRLHAVAEEAITTREIATLIAQAYDLDLKSVDPAEAAAHFGVVGHFFAHSLTASSTQTRRLLNWTPTAPTLAQDLTTGAYGPGSPQALK